MRTPLLLYITILCGISSAITACAEPIHNVFDAKAYGAAGDGVSDDTGAIQKTIDAAVAAGGGIVQLPRGTCLLDSNHPSSHPWFFYNLSIGSNVTLRGQAGTRLLQGPGGRHAPLPDATQVRNTVLVVGGDYAAIRFQRASQNGGFHRLLATVANESSVTLSRASDGASFKAGDFVAIYQSTAGDVIPTETSRVVSANHDSGVLTLNEPLARSFATPSIANVTALATTNVGVQDLTVQGAEPLAVTETFGFRAEKCEFISDTTTGAGNAMGVNLNTLHDFQFVGNVFDAVGPVCPGLELAQRNSRNGLYDKNRFIVSSVGFGEYAAHIRLTRNQFNIRADRAVVAGIAIGGLDVEFSDNDVRGGNVTGGSGWGVILADFIGPSDYASYVARVRITHNTFDCRADGNAILGIFAADTMVADNTIKTTGNTRGIHAEGPLPQSNRITGNKLMMDQGDGMLIVTPKAGGGSVVTGNSITGSGACGIDVDAHGAANAGGNRIEDNTITGFKKAAVIR